MQRSTTGRGSQDAGTRVESHPSVPGERESVGTADSRAQMPQGPGKAKRRAEYSKPWKQQPAAKTLVSVTGCQTSERDLGAAGGAATKFPQATPESPKAAAGEEARKPEGSSADGSRSLLAKSLGGPAAAGLKGEEDEGQEILRTSGRLPMAGPEAVASEEVSPPLVHMFDPKVTKRVSLGSAGPKGQSTHSEGEESLATGARTGLLNFRAPSQGEDSPAARALLATGGDGAGLTYPTEASAAKAKRGPLQGRSNEVHRLSSISQRSPGTLKTDSMQKSGVPQRDPAGQTRESPRGALLGQSNPGGSVEAQLRGHAQHGGLVMGQNSPPPDWVSRSLEWAQHHCPHCEHARSPRHVAVRDMGSLKLTEVLRFQQDGRCCRSSCPHCRRTHKCDLTRQVKRIDYSRGADAGELLRTTPRPYDFEIERLRRSSRPRQGKPPVKPAGEPVQAQSPSPSALARNAGRRSQTLAQDSRAEATEAPRMEARGDNSSVQLCIDGVVASRVLKKQPIALASAEGQERRARRSLDQKTKSIFPGSGMSFSLDKKIDSRIVIENAHESASCDSGLDPHGTLPRVDHQKRAAAQGRSVEGLGRRGDSPANSGLQSLGNLESATPQGATLPAPLEKRGRPAQNVQTGPRDCHLAALRDGASPGRTGGRRSSCDTGSPQKSSTWHQISPRLASPRRGAGESGPSGPGTQRPQSPSGPGAPPARIDLRRVQQMENSRRKQGTPGGVSISVKVPKELRAGGPRDGEGVDSNGQRQKNVSQINLALEQTLESQNADGGAHPGARPIGGSIMTYVVVDMAEGERSRAQDRGQTVEEEGTAAARATLYPAPQVHVVNSPIFASHAHKQTMPFNHFRHPSMGKAAVGRGVRVGSRGGPEPMQHAPVGRMQRRQVGPVMPGNPSPRNSAEPGTAYWPGRGFARSQDRTPPEIQSAARVTSPHPSKAAATLKSETLNKDLLPFGAATEEGTGDHPRGEIGDSRDPLRALNTGRGAEAISERFQNRSIQSKIAATMESPGALRNSVEQSRNRWPEGQQNLSTSAVPSCEGKVVLLTRGGRDSQLIREATRGAGFRLNAPKPLSIPGTNREPHAGGVTSRSTAERDVRLTSTIEELQTKLRGSNALEGVPLRGSDGAPTPSLGASASPVKLRSTFFFGSRADERGSSQFPYQYVEALASGGPQAETRFADSAEHGEDAAQADHRPQPSPELLRLNLDGLQDRRAGGHETLGSTRGVLFSGASVRPLAGDGLDKTAQLTTQEVLITGQSLGTPALRGSAHAAGSGRKHPNRPMYPGDRDTIKRIYEGLEQANLGGSQDANAALLRKIDSKGSKNSPILASQGSQFDAPSKRDGSVPQSSRHSPTRGRPPPFRVQLDRRKNGTPHRGDAMPDRQRYPLEVLGASKEINRNYIRLQQKISENLAQHPQNFPGKFHANVDMINMAQQAFHEIDILIQEGAPRSPQGSKDRTKSPATFAPNRNEPGRPLKASPVQSVTSVNSMTHRDRFIDIEDEDQLNVSPKQGFLNLPKYGPSSKLNHNAAALTGMASPKQGQSRFGPYTPQEMQDPRLQSDLEHYAEFGHGLEIQGTEVQMLDPHLAKESLQKRNQIIRKIDRDHMKTPVKSNNESLAHTPQNGKITVTMDPKARDFQVMEGRMPSQQINLGSRGYNGQLAEPPANQDLHSGSGAAIATSVFGRNSPIPPNTLNLNIKTDAQHQLDITLHQSQREDPDNTIDLPLSNKGERKRRQSHAHIKNQPEVERNSSVAAGTSSSISQKHAHGARARSSQFMIEDIKLFRDFVLYYNKPRFKKLKAQKHAKNDLILLNQEQLCENEEIRGLYYQLRDQKRLDTHMRSVKSKIEQKMQEIRRADKKHREQLIKQGDLMDDEGEKEGEKRIAEQPKENKGQDKHETQQKYKTSAIQKKGRYKSEQISKQQQEDTKQHQINEEKIFQDTMIQMNRRAQNGGPLADKRREQSLDRTMATVTIDSRISMDVSRQDDDVCIYEANTVRPNAIQDISKFVVQSTTRTQKQEMQSAQFQGLVENSPIKYRQDSIISKDAGSAGSTRRVTGPGTTSRGKTKDSWNLASSMVDRDSLKLKEAIKFNTRKSVKMSAIRDAMYNNHYLSEIKRNFSVRHPDCSKIGYATTRGRIDLVSTGQDQQDSRYGGAARTSESIQESGIDNNSINKTTVATVEQTLQHDGPSDPQTQNHSGRNQRLLSNTPLTTDVRPQLRQFGGLPASLDIGNSSLSSPGVTKGAWKDQADQRRGKLKTSLHTGRVRDKRDSTRAAFNNTQNKFHIKPLSPLDALEGRRAAGPNKASQPPHPNFLASEYIILKDQQTDLHETTSLWEQEQKGLFGGSPGRGKSTKIDSADYIDYLSSKGAMLPMIAQNHAKQMAEARASKGWPRGQGRVEETKLFHIDLYRQRAQRKQQNLGKSSVFESPLLAKKGELKMNQQTIDYIGTLLPSTKEKSGFETILPGGGVPHPRLLENRLGAEVHGGDGSNKTGIVSPRTGYSALYDQATVSGERPSAFADQNLQRVARRVNNSVDFGNIQAPHGKRKSLCVGKRLKAKQHMVPFEEIKPVEFTKAKPIMRNAQEERDRLLGPQFRKEYIKAKNAREAAFEREQLQALDNFLRDGLTAMDESGEL